MPPVGIEHATLTHAAQTITQLTKFERGKKQKRPKFYALRTKPRGRDTGGFTISRLPKKKQRQWKIGKAKRRNGKSEKREKAMFVFPLSPPVATFPFSFSFLGAGAIGKTGNRESIHPRCLDLGA